MATKFIFPKPKDKLILFDLDETLIDRAQKTNNRNLKEAIVIAQDEGWTIGLSSDTPLKQLKVWKERFGMNGPIIAERGAIVEVGSKVLFANEGIRDIFTTSFRAVVEKLKGQESRVELGSPIELLRQDEPFGKPNETVIFANNLRECSIGLFVFKTDENGRLRPNSYETEKIAKIVEPAFPKISTLATHVNQENGIIIASDKRIDKRMGTLLLMRELNLSKIGMVGDLLLDNVGNDIAIHYAVRNASEEFKKIASYTSSFERASGAVEILENLHRID